MAKEDKNRRHRRDALLANLYYSQFQRIGIGAFLPSLAFLAASTIVWSSRHIYSVSFYEVSAQVIPVLMLALALELRAFELPQRRYRFKAPQTLSEARKRISDPAQQEFSDRLRGLLVLLAMIAAELLSLRSVAYESGGRFAQGFIVGSVAAGLAMIAIRVVFPSRVDGGSGSH